ncbi:hypothetical protein HYN24_02055 [Dechloromonas sp. HYN0024]|nr:hypothetical protein HYN24_02055 [Dechloromonas sp. HYN0024]
MNRCFCGKLGFPAQCLDAAMLLLNSLCRTLFCLLTLLAMPAFSADVAAARLSAETVEVDYRNGTYFARLGFFVAASPAVAIEVLTDFNHMAGVVPNLESSQIVSRRDNVYVVRQRGRASFGPFSFPFESVRQIEVHADGRILAHALSGTTKYMRSELRVHSVTGGAHVDYQIEMVPDRWIPSSLGVNFMGHELAEQFSALIGEMERRQNMARVR